MATLLEDLPIDDNADDQVNEYKEYPDREYPDSEYQEEQNDNDQYMTDPTVIKNVFEKLKEPTIVAALVFLFSNQTVVSSLSNIPKLGIYIDGRNSIIWISILIGLVFLAIKEFLL